VSKSFVRHRPLFEKELTTGMEHILKAGERPKHQPKANLEPHPATSAKNKKKEAIKNENVVFNYKRLMIMWQNKNSSLTAMPPSLLKLCIRRKKKFPSPMRLFFPSRPPGRRHFIPVGFSLRSLLFFENYFFFRFLSLRVSLLVQFFLSYTEI